MATLITKNSSTASSVPTAAQLVQGELAVNVTDKRLFTENSSGTVVELGTNPSTLALPNGTANGVAYLNGSKVLTTGSALVYDGTILRVNGSTTSGLRLSSNSATSNGFNLYNDSSTDIAYLMNFYNGSMVFGVNNTEQARLTSTGLGIGTSSPVSKLDIDGNFIRIRQSGANAGFFGNAADLITGAPAGLGIRFDGSALRIAASSSQIAMFDSAGNFGLGVTPSAWRSGALSYDVARSSYADENGTLTIASNAYRATSNWLYKVSTFATRMDSDSGQFRWYTAPSGTAGNAISFTQVMTLDASGRLGIGNTSPSYLLDIFGTTPGIRLRANGVGTGVKLEQSSATGDVELNVMDGYALRFATTNTERARITSGGDLLVGTTTASARLTLQQSGSQDVIRVNVGTGGSGYVVIGSGTTMGAAYFQTSSGFAGQITCSGTTTSYATSSDYRLKENVQPMTGALAKVAALKPCTYKWKTDGSDGEGFIAHELAEVVPQCVTGEKDAVDADGNPVYQGIDTSFLVATLTAAIQEQQAIINQLKARLDAANL